jgi:hypothetical protein
MLFMNYSLRTLNELAPYPGGIVQWQKYKMVNGNELYNLEMDEGEIQNLASESPALLRRLDSAYLAWWYRDVAIHKPRPPVSVGYAEEPQVILPPHIGRARGGLQYFGWRGMYREVRRHGRHPTGVDSDWVTNWKSGNDTLRWEIRVVAGREYDFSLTLGGSITQGAAFGLSCGDVTLSCLPDNSIQATDGWITKGCGTIVLGPGTYDVSLFPVSLSPADSIAVRNVLVLFQ